MYITFLFLIKTKKIARTVWLKIGSDNLFHDTLKKLRANFLQKKNKKLTIRLKHDVICSDLSIFLQIVNNTRKQDPSFSQILSKSKSPPLL